MLRHYSWGMIFMVLAVSLGVFAAPSIPAKGLLAWFDATDEKTLTLDGDRVQAWKSKSTPECVATAKDSQCPVYIARKTGPLRSAIRFDGTDDLLRISSFSQKCDTWSLVAVVAPYIPMGGGGICSACPATSQHDYDPGFTVDLYQSSDKFDQISVEGAGRIGGQQDQMKSALKGGGFHVLEVIRQANQVTLYIDGVLEGTRPVDPKQTDMEVLRIGARCYAGQERNFFHGEIAQLLLYGHDLDAAERKQVEDMLKVSPGEIRQGEEALAKLKEQYQKNRMVAPKVMKSWPDVEAFVKENGEALDPAKLPIRTDLREAIALSVHHLNSLYDKDKDNEPFFFINREADGFGKMHHSVNIGIPHVVGRCLVGCMMAEKCAQVPFPADGLAILERYCKSSYANPDHLNSYYDPEKKNERFVEYHNMREGLYGLWALIAGRQSTWARDEAHQMLATLDKLTTPDGLWSVDLLKQAGMDPDHSPGFAAPNTSRIIDPLLAYYDCTKDPLAMKLAKGYSEQALKILFMEDGRFAPMERSSGHVHTITSSLSGITDYAARTGNKAMLDKCRQIMEVGVPEYFSSWGWGDEVFPVHPADVISRGEINQTGDVVRTALILGDAGYADYYETAERFVRSMLLPTQYHESDLRKVLRDKPNPKDDSERDTVMRSVGGYAMQLPNARIRMGDWPISTLDITSGAVHAMSECYRHRTTLQDGRYRMNLLFDYDDAALTLKSQLPKAGHIAFSAKQAIAELQIRIPQWVDRKSINLVVAGKSLPVGFEGAYVRVPSLAKGQEGILAFNVSCKTETETVDGVVYTTTWVGNQMVDIKPRGGESPLPF